MFGQYPLKYSAPAALLTAFGLAALLLPLPQAVRTAAALLFVAGLGAYVGAGLLPSERRPWRAFFGAIMVAASLILVGSALYYAYRLDAAMSALALVLVGALSAVFRVLARRRATVFGSIPARTSAEDRPRGVLLLVLGTAACAALVLAARYGFSILDAAATSDSIRSPWDVVPRLFFIVVFLTVLGTFAAALGGAAPRLTLVPAALLAVLAVSVAVRVYDVGFGFDPFIHQATEKVIRAEGAIDPKPLYYVGHYAAVTLISRLTGLDVVAVDGALVPAMFLLLVPAAYWSLRRAFAWTPSVSAAASLGILLLPLGSFAATTPQGFANAIFLLTVFLALPAAAGAGFPRMALAVLGAAAAAVHPLAGIPLLIFVGILAYLTTYERTRGAHEFGRLIVLAEIVALGSLALPAVFVINAALSGTGVSLDVETLKTPSAIIESLQSANVVTRRFQALLDLTYSWKEVRAAVILLAGAVGIAILHRRARAGAIWLASAIAFLANFVLLRAVVRFPFLIEYERTNYADRIFELTLFLLAPAAIVAFGALISRLQRSFPALRIGATVLVAALATSSIYLAYPRRDTYESSRGWSTSAADVDAVKLIDDDAKGKKYIVLANQSVSAAAVRELGFKRYFRSQDKEHPGLIFYYPIPTGDVLYRRFLDMNAAYGSRNVADKVLAMTGADAVYYVVSYYWWEAQRIIVLAERQADRTWKLDGKNWVFKYERK